jgi:flagellar biosynthetic protein FliR
VLDDFIAALALTLARAGTFLFVVPLIGGSNIPRTVKVGLAMALTALFFEQTSATLARAGGLEALGLTNWLGFGLAIGREMILGGCLGLALSLFLLPAHVAAEFISQEAGLSFANVVTATGSNSASALTVIFELLASVLFLGLDLHHIFLLVLQDTFISMPIGQAFQLPNWELVGAVSAAEEGGIVLVAPVAMCLFLTTVVLALVTRAAPQLHIYSIGFPLRVLVGLGAMLLLLPQLVAGMVSMFSLVLHWLQLRG